jgi:hypothetical protein
MMDWDNSYDGGKVVCSEVQACVRVEVKLRGLVNEDRCSIFCGEIKSEKD